MSRGREISAPAWIGHLPEEDLASAYPKMSGADSWGFGEGMCGSCAAAHMNFDKAG